MSHICCYRFGADPDKCVCTRDAYRRNLWFKLLNLLCADDAEHGSNHRERLELAGERGSITSWCAAVMRSDDTELQSVLYGWIDDNRSEILTLIKLAAETKTVHHYLTSFGGKEFADAMIIFLNFEEGHEEKLKAEHMQAILELVLDF